MNTSDPSILRRRRRAALGALLLTVAGLAPRVQAQTPASDAMIAPTVASMDAARREFVQQISALDAMPSPLLTDPAGTDSDALRGYVLYPYLEAQRLRAPLRFGLAADDAAVATFLLRHGDAPWTRDLRRDWLLDLARRRQWSPYLANYLDNRADARLRCERLNALIASRPPEELTPTASPAGAATTAGGGEALLRTAVLESWNTGAQLPDACAAPFEYARSRGWITPELAEQRARLALVAGNADLAGFLLKPLPPERAPALRGWARLLGNPERELDALIAGGAPALQAQDPEAIAAVVTKLARRDPPATTSRLDRLVAACGTPCPLASPARPAELRRELALAMAWSRLPQTVGAFRAMDESAADERAREWRIRAALWAGDWAQAAAWIGALPPDLATQQRWRYWQARVRERQQGLAAARALYEPLAAENGYYPLLSAWRLQRGYVPTPAPGPKDLLAQQQLAATPAMVRIRELWLAQRSAWSSLEWGEQIAGMGKPQLLQAARLAQTWGAQVQTVTAASKAGVFDDFELLYPRPFDPEVGAASKLSGVPEEWIYAVMRQESLYDPRAQSKANALGLLQMLLGTARDTARRQGQLAPSGSDLFVPEINTRLGALHLKELLERYNGEFVQVLGAYNAGPKPVARWQPPGRLDADIWIENVPYNETRNYIQRVIFHSVVFGWRGSGAAQKIDRVMTPVGGVADVDAIDESR